MKKILCVLLLLLSGCAIQDYVLVTQETKEVEQYDFKVSEAMKVARSIHTNLNNGEMTTTYISDENIDLDELVHLLSFVVPYDLKVSQSSIPLLKGIRNIFKIQYFDQNIETTNKMIDQVIAYNIDDTMSDQQKVDFVHKFIIDHCEYDTAVIERTEENETAFQIEGVMMSQKAVCSGYARTFMLFMKKLDIPCLYVSSDIINHSFNLVYTDDFYFIDTTWDEGTNSYYNLDSESFFNDGKHTLEEIYNREYFLNFLVYMYLLTS